MKQIRAKDTNGDDIFYLTQWDQNITINLIDDLITDAYDIHFQINSSDEAYIVPSEYNDGVLTVVIPGGLLETAGVLIGYVYLEEDESKQSILSFRIGVIPRGEPVGEYISDTAYTLYTYEELLTLYNSLNETAETLSNAKSAYDYAVEGGYTGTEEEFANAMNTIVSLINAEEEEY